MSSSYDVAIPCEELGASCVQHQATSAVDCKKLPRRLVRVSGGDLQGVGESCPLIGGVEDHVHALFSLSKNHALKKIVEEVKTGSSKWMKNEGPRVADFYWQGGYAAFSVSQSNVEAVKRYIKNQEEHHRKMTFQDELRELFQRHGIEFDERYVWD